MMLAVLLVFCIFPLSLCLQCSIPPDFWCDHPVIERLCTGSKDYCDNYKLNVQAGRISMKLAFESYCPDSQAFVVDRLYRQVISNPNVSSLVDLKAIPWGLARRQLDGSVNCHHRERECIGNRHISCALHFLQNAEQKNRLLYCVMNHLLYRGRVADGITDCLSGVGMASVNNDVLRCSNGPFSHELQKADEMETKNVLINEQKFVPYVQFGNKSSLHMQYYQLILAQKLKTMASTVHSALPRKKYSTSTCTTPPDFWCSTPSITNECFNEDGCMMYFNSIYGKSLEFTILYDSSEPISREYVKKYVGRTLLKEKELQGKMTVILRATAISPAEDRSCAGRSGTNCHDYAIQECIASKVSNKHEVSRLLHCLLESHQTPGDMQTTWESKCHFLQDVYNKDLKEDILNCASTKEWRVYWRRRLQMETSLMPEPKTSDPWILLNGFSLKSVQIHANILHRMVCAWYRGPGHNRDLCGRCEYEPTHC